MSAYAHACSFHQVIEEVPVGDSVCLFRPDNWATALLNAPAAAQCATILNRSEDGCGTGATGNPLIDALERQLLEAGFFDPARRPASTSIPSEVPRPAVGGALQRYTLPERAIVGLCCEDPELSVLLAATLDPLALATEAEPHCVIAVTGNTPNLSVWCQNCQIAAGLDRAEARRVALQAMLMALVPHSEARVILHASAVSWSGRAIVMSGATGAGKSTLALELVADGCGFLADDFTPLGSSGLMVSRFPAAASVKSGSTARLTPLFPELDRQPVHAIGERRVRYLNVSARTRGPSPCAVALIAFPTFRADATNALERLSPEETLSLLLSSGSDIVGASRSIQPLARLVNTIPAYRLTYSDSSWARHTLLRLVDAP